MDGSHCSFKFFVSLSPLLLAGVLGITPSAWATCATLAATGTQGTEKETDMLLTLDGWEEDCESPKKHIGGRGPQSTIAYDYTRSLWWAILWDDTDARYELHYLTSGESDNWTSSEIPVHKCMACSSTTTQECRIDDDCPGVETCTTMGPDNCSGGYSDDDDSDTARYKRRYDMQFKGCGYADDLYVMSHRQTGQNETDDLPGPVSSGASADALFYRYTAVTRCDGTQPDDICDDNNQCDGDCDVPSWDLDTGFPLIVKENYKLEAVEFAIDEEDNEQIMAVWTQPNGSAQGEVHVAATDAGCACEWDLYSDTSGSTTDCAFDNTATIQGNEYLQVGHCETTTTTACEDDTDCYPEECTNTWDDMASIEYLPASNAFGVLWSDQSRDKFSFKYLNSGGNISTGWSAAETALSGTGMADDHIFTTSWDQSAELMAVIKTSKDDCCSETDPLTQLLIRTPNDGRCDDDENECLANHSEWCDSDDDCDDVKGVWHVSEISDVESEHTRPVLVWDRTAECLHYFATARDTSYYKIVEQAATVDPHYGPWGNSEVTWQGQQNRIDESGRKHNDAIVGKWNAGGANGDELLVVSAEFEFCCQNCTGEYRHYRDLLPR